MPPGLPAQVLAEPVIWGHDQPVPIATRTPIGWQPWLWGGDGSFYWPGRHRRNAALHYVQVWRAKAEPNLSPKFHLTDSNPDERIRPLLQNPVPRVKEYADGLLDKLIQDRQLPADCRDPNTGLPRPQFHDRIAQAFNNHLATTPELRYTTKLRRTRKDVDPVEDFLFHTRAGHCERFASALALLLRSQGIPAVLVLGFKGWEATPDPQQYLVKQDHAHAWVEALIVEFEPPPPGTNEPPVSRWRSLDPTPSGQPSTDTPSEGWVALARDWVQDRFRGVFTSGTSTEGLVATFGRWEILAAGCLVMLAVVLRWWVPSARRSSTPASPESALLGRLFALLAAYGFAPVPGDTPREFTSTVGDALGKSPATAAVAGVPTDFVEAYYESRFGGRVLSQERLAALDAALGELERALKLASTGR
ncbi:MAG: transglutaminase domain-containing protein [Gemmataceae bacterium]